MATQLIEKKIKALKKKIEKFLLKKDADIEGVHKIRTSSREILSLLNNQKLHSVDLKKILKLSNKIRDIDVLITEYLTKIPKDKKVNKLLIKNILKEERKKELIVFLEYLRVFSKQNIEFFKKDEIDIKSVKKPYFCFDKKQLHKFRIFIKNQLYLAKNSPSKDINTINFLTQIKDILGYINDNHNAVKILASLPLDAMSKKELKKFTKEQNIKYFTQVKELVLQLENNL